MSRATYRRRADGVCEIVRPRRVGRIASRALEGTAAAGTAFALVAAGALLLLAGMALAVPLAAGALVALAAVLGPGALRRLRAARRAAATVTPPERSSRTGR